MVFELGVVWADGGWDAEHFVEAASEKEAHEELWRRIQAYERKREVVKIFTYHIQEKGDESS